ncbi:MAG TPA: aldehyde dehydrogenase family protein, partial [Myxococcota bacterium]
MAERFLDALVAAARELRPGDPADPATTFGPLATREALERFLRMRAAAVSAGCEQLLAGSALAGGAFVTPSIHLLPEGMKEAPGYLDEELFGPDICVEIVDDIDEAIARTNALPYGLSNAIFTVDPAKVERFYERTKSGCLNWNRSTNNASGKLPFGGVGRSGNQRPAGIDAVRYTTFPVAVLRGEMGDAPVEPAFVPAFKAGEERLKMAFDRLSLRHKIESTLEKHRIYVDDVRGPDLLVPLEQLTDLTIADNLLEPEDIIKKLAPYASLEEPYVVITAPEVEEGDPDGERVLVVVRALLDDLARDNPVHLLRLLPRAVRRPPGGKLPRSEALLRRMYRGDFIPREKKEPVIDLGWSEGPYMASIDDDALVILDAGSQIASLGLGFAPGTFLAALDAGDLGEALAANLDTEAIGADRTHIEEYTRFLVKQCWPGIRYASFTSGGAEANEKAFDLCRMHGPGGKRVVCFEGSFHGRTLAALYATHNPEKRKPFEIKGYEASFVPFPRWSDPREEPPVDDAWITAWATGQTPGDEGDPLLQIEIESLVAVRNEIKKGDLCCVIIEPMQGEGGDNYATARFFAGLRALTRGFGVPLVFDEVQTGFGLGGSFWWHSLFNLRNQRGQPDGPDCIVAAKKAQVGVCLSVWPDPRPAPAHTVQLQRGLLHAQGIVETSSREIQTE